MLHGLMANLHTPGMLHDQSEQYDSTWEDDEGDLDDTTQVQSLQGSALFFLFINHVFFPVLANDSMFSFPHVTCRNFQMLLMNMIKVHFRSQKGY